MFFKWKVTNKTVKCFNNVRDSLTLDWRNCDIGPDFARLVSGEQNTVVPFRKLLASSFYRQTYSNLFLPQFSQAQDKHYLPWIPGRSLL